LLGFDCGLILGIFNRILYLRGVKIQSVSIKLIDQAHLYILNNIVEVIPYILQHIDETKSAHPRMSEKLA